MGSAAFMIGLGTGRAKQWLTYTLLNGLLISISARFFARKLTPEDERLLAEIQLQMDRQFLGGT